VSPPELDDDPLWFKNAVIYQTHVRAFFDSDRDGVGDFRGLTEKLDYIQELGVTAIWILPFYPSPLRDGGYDISDYTGVHPSYGTMRDFRRFVRAAHARGIRVITELVLNHTSDQHPWFQRARRAKPGSKWRDWYVWSDTADKYRGTRIIFKDFETSNWSWDEVAGAYYWHRFYAHQPDLNWDNPAVEKELIKVVDFWLDLGVDGLRLDAVPYLYEREGTTNENLPETHAALKRLRAHIDEEYEGRMLLAEANMWPEDSVAYFGEGDGDECHMCFHFPLMPRLYMAMQSEDRFPLIDIMQQTPEIPANCQWAIFLRNHDELTLEMVTDEERDYMYRSYAANPRARINLGIRRRLAPLLDNDRRKIELLNGLLFSFNGSPIVYYGDEIGMGDNIYLGDRDGVRTPMQWNADRNAGFSKADPQQLYLPVNIDPEYRYEAVNVEAQQRNMSSLWWWTKRLIALRRRHTVLGHGSLTFLTPDNPRILAFVREHEDETMLVVANLSRSVQYAELDLSAYEGRVPREVFGRIRFPRVGDLPYLLTLGPYAFMWFDLSAKQAAGELSSDSRTIPSLRSKASFDVLTNGRSRTVLERALPQALASRRWFGGKAREVDSVEIVDCLVPNGAPLEHEGRILVVEVTYEAGASETYLLPVAFLSGPEGSARLENERWDALVRVERSKDPEDVGVVVDAMGQPAFRDRLLRAVLDRKGWQGRHGRLRGVRTRAHKAIASFLEGRDEVESSLNRAEQSNTSVDYGGEIMLKLLRKGERGENPDLEIGRYLTERSGNGAVKRGAVERAPAVPLVLGGLEYRDDKEPMTVAVVQGYVENHGDAWEVTLHRLGAYLEKTLSQQEASSASQRRREPAVPSGLRLADVVAPGAPEVHDEVGDFLHLIQELGLRVAELHLSLGQPTADDAFAPESYTSHYRRGLYQSMRQQCVRTLQLLSKRVGRLPEEHQGMARGLVGRRDELLARFKRLVSTPLDGQRIRCHGDLHLGQVLFAGRGWVIIDFEGEPARPVGERRIKRSPLRDVAGMIRSFDYARHHALAHQVANGTVARGSDAYEALEQAAGHWHQWIRYGFLGSYLDAMDDGGLLPPDAAHRALLLDAYLLDKAIYELAYELNMRPDKVAVPLVGVTTLLDEQVEP
jgi:maltose alpha-D-glucosyltransferase/alpha-amylase